jgi:hypothetical protein
MDYTRDGTVSLFVERIIYTQVVFKLLRLRDHLEVKGIPLLLDQTLIVGVDPDGILFGHLSDLLGIQIVLPGEIVRPDGTLFEQLLPAFHRVYLPPKRNF